MKLKKVIYIAFTILLVLELIAILHSLLESWYLSMFASSGSLPSRNDFWFFSSYLPLYIPALLIIAGVTGGYFLGQWWWHIIYVEKRRWKKV